MKNIFIAFMALVLVCCNTDKNLVNVSFKKFAARDDGNLYVEGETNLPEGTNLLAKMLKDNVLSSQDSTVVVKNRRFTAVFANEEKLTSNMTFQFICYANTDWQSTENIHTIKNMSSEYWMSDSLLLIKNDPVDRLDGNLYDLYKDEFIGYAVISTTLNHTLKAPQNYTPVGELQPQWRDITVNGKRKISADIKYNQRDGNELYENDMAYFQSKIIKETEGVDVICLQCYEEGAQKPFQSRILVNDNKLEFTDDCGKTKYKVKGEGIIKIQYKSE
ncbi:hypothetical protein [Plebeiibacterium sediminum]|uniref:Uncharacterized protein n=1 Tax=Plebeiibacterium sediminum TaxID=2992112 RepID=A0AAE3M4U1_9BACT|nr:hypothetical protein [Plebeiobacterium sediminum]MCW3787139.1 hypothetical protein [Plebeiobacterium sediminum]